MDKHAMFHQWIALSNPLQANFNDITGYLKASISVVREGDEQVPLNEDTSVDKTDEGFIIVPPHIQVSYYQLWFKFFIAENLPDLDNMVGGGDTDAYIRCDFLGQKLKTHVKSQKKGKVEWMEEMLIPA